LSKFHENDFKIVPGDYYLLYLYLIGRHSCGWEIIAMAADNAMA